MPGLRSRRLEQLLGGPIDETLTYAQVKRLIPEAIEGPDLDFKRETYSSGERDRKSLSTDVAALANAAGGILILGMDEDEQGRATNDPGVSISDDERRRLRQTVYGNIQPVPNFGVIPVQDPDRPGTGFLIIWVERSPGTPHAYVAQNKSLLYPRRIGTETVQLSESEVAEAYRARFAGLSNRIAEAARLEQDFTTRLDTGQVWLVSTLVPDLPGHFRIDSAALKRFHASVQDQAASGIGLPLWAFGRSGVRHRRLVAAGNHEADKPYSRSACELHENGSATFAACLDTRQRASALDDDTGSRLNDEETVAAIAATLQFLALHARDRAAAGGLATLRVTLYPVTAALPAQLIHNRHYGLEHGLGTHPVTEPPVADAVADLDELTTPGRELLSVTYRLATGLFQEFGRPEALQLNPDGNLRRLYWGHHTQQVVTRWAQDNGVEVVDEKVG